MQKEMININGNLIGEIEIKIIRGKDRKVTVANFTLLEKWEKREKKRRNISTVISTEKR